MPIPFLDGCDGELARLKFKESRWGGLLDFWGDNSRAYFDLFLYGPRLEYEPAILLAFVAERLGNCRNTWLGMVRLPTDDATQVEDRPPLYLSGSFDHNAFESSHGHVGATGFHLSRAPTLGIWKSQLVPIAHCLLWL